MLENVSTLMGILRKDWAEMMTYAQTGKEQRECALWISGRRTIHQRKQLIQRHRGKTMLSKGDWGS